MCGVAGLVWRDVRRAASRAAVEGMCRALAHRGPDGEGIFCDGPLALGHRRLAILDLTSAGAQPMSDATGRYVIVHNGEIYNYVELREDLRRHGARFRSTTDTEVVLEAYRVWGPECVLRFNGMWAFAVYDRREEILFLSRDRLGIKPLYYLLDEECFTFASEIKGILVARPGARRPDRSWIARFLPSGLRDDRTQTAFDGVVSLAAAHNAQYDLRRSRLRTWRYWSLAPAVAEAARFGTQAGRLSHVAGAEPAHPVETLGELLHSAVRLQMRSDVPVGTCLSGGLDSSTLVAIMAGMRDDPVHTFSGLYDDAACNEQQYVQAVNRHAGTRPAPVRPGPEGDLVDDLRRIAWHQDEPTAGPGLYTQYHVMRRAAQDVKVVLDGQGGDELFAGYLYYFRPHLRDLVQHSPILGRWRALMLLGLIVRHWGFDTATGGWNAMLRGALRRLARRLHMAPAATAGGMLHPSLAQGLRHAGEAGQAGLPQPFDAELTNSLYTQVTQTSLPTLLHYEDRNSMAHSIEARVPLLDHRIVEFAFTLAPEWKISGSWTKWVLRRAVERLLPPEVVWRRSKMGYPTPMARWLRQSPDREQVAEILFSRSLAQREIVCPQALQQAWREHQAGIDHSWLLYRVLVIELWHQHFIDAWSPMAVPDRRRAAA